MAAEVKTYTVATLEYEKTLGTRLNVSWKANQA